MFFITLKLFFCLGCFLDIRCARFHLEIEIVFYIRICLSFEVVEYRLLLLLLLYIVRFHHQLSSFLGSVSIEEFSSFLISLPPEVLYRIFVLSLLDVLLFHERCFIFLLADLRRPKVELSPIRYPRDACSDGYSFTEEFIKISLLNTVSFWHF